MCIAALATMLVIAILSGCEKRDDGSYLHESLQTLHATFGLTWPTNNISAARTASWNPRDALDRDAKNTEFILRFTLPSADYIAWQLSATNVMKEYAWGATRDPKLIDGHPWWNIHDVPDSRIIHLFAETNVATGGMTQLDVYAVETNKTHTVYIHSRTLNR